MTSSFEVVDKTQALKLHCLIGLAGRANLWARFRDWTDAAPPSGRGQGDPFLADKVQCSSVNRLESYNGYALYVSHAQLGDERKEIR